ncbi:hypothetical protein ACA910_007577 [Epithemia clementina (nom. ined.)]
MNNNCQTPFLFSPGFPSNDTSSSSSSWTNHNKDRNTTSGMYGNNQSRHYNINSIGRTGLFGAVTNKGNALGDLLAARTWLLGATTIPPTTAVVAKGYPCYHSDDSSSLASSEFESSPMSAAHDSNNPPTNTYDRPMMKKHNNQVEQEDSTFPVVRGSYQLYPTTASSAGAATTLTALMAANHHKRNKNEIHPDKEKTQIPPSISEDNNLLHLPALRDRIRKQVHAVITHSGWPSSQTAAYLQADPELVLLETDPLQFVRYFQYRDLELAAQRLCSYWTARLAVFGPDRAFLPLTLTGTGALHHEDLMHLRAGYPALLPKHPTTGQSCVWFDRRNRVPNAPTKAEHLLRALFYVYKVLAANEISQGEGPESGVVVLLMAATPRSKGREDVDWEFVNRSAQLITKAFPVKLQVHLISIPQQRKPSFARSVVQATLQVLRDFISQHNNNNNNSDNSLKQLPAQQQQKTIATTMTSCAYQSIHLHQQQPVTSDSSSEMDILNDLLALGLSKEGIPHCLGGDWNLTQFVDWCQERMEWEQSAYSKWLPKPETADATANKPTTLSWKKITKGVAPAHMMVKTPLRTATSEPTSNGAQDSTAASGTTTSGTPTVKLSKQERLAQRRMEDLIRSRRKRERQRMELETLQNDSSRLKAEHEQLLEEQNRLQALLQLAQQQIASVRPQQI